MWHVPEGDLHAYLDGALGHYPGEEAERIRGHLEACEACRERLEDERTVRDRAGEVLEQGAPGPVTPPPFEEIRRQAETRRAGGADGRDGRPGSWGPRLAWAASLVVALGVGWAVGREPRVVGAPEGEATQTAPSDPGTTESRAVAADAAVPGEADAPTGTDAPTSGRVAEAGTDSSLGRGGLSLGAVVVDSPVAQDERVEVARDTSGERVVASAKMDSSPSDSGRLTEPERGVALNQIVVRGVDTVPDVARPAAPLAAREEVLQRRRADAEAEAGSPPPPETRAGLRGVLLPGLEVVSVQWGVVAPDREGFRVVQRIPGDSIIVELRFGGIGSAAASPSVGGGGEARDGAAVPEELLREELPEGWNRTAAPFGTGWVLIRGPLSVDELRRLLRRLGG